MLVSALVAAFHFLALGLGLTGITLRGRGLRAGDVPAVLHGDALWGLAALLWLGTGLARAFGGLEKGSAFYLHQPFFWVKMALFVAVLLLEIGPMVTFIRWRVALGKGLAPDLSRLPLLARVNAVELGLTVLIPFAAVAMARGM